MLLLALVLEGGFVCLWGFLFVAGVFFVCLFWLVGGFLGFFVCMGVFLFSFWIRVGVFFGTSVVGVFSVILICRLNIR